MPDDPISPLDWLREQKRRAQNRANPPEAEARDDNPLTPALDFLAQQCVPLIVRLSEFAADATTDTVRTADAVTMRALGRQVQKFGASLHDSTVATWNGLLRYGMESRKVCKVDPRLKTVVEIGLRLEQAGHALDDAAAADNHRGAATHARHAAERLLSASQAWNALLGHTAPLDRPCPSADCGGILRRRRGPGGPFLGCSKYPICRHTEILP